MSNKKNQRKNQRKKERKMKKKMDKISLTSINTQTSTSSFSFSNKIDGFYNGIISSTSRILNGTGNIIYHCAVKPMVMATDSMVYLATLPFQLVCLFISNDCHYISYYHIII